MLLAAFILFSFFMTKTTLSQTCTNGGDSFRDIRFNKTTYSYCYHLPTSDCSSSTSTGNYVAAVNETCDLLDVTAAEVPHTILTAPDYRGSERCGCLTPYGGKLVIVIDANPIYVSDESWQYRIINTLDWFYHYISRRSGPSISITYIFAHGSDYYETSNPEVYNDFANVTYNPYIANATISQAVTQPCNAINRALTILNAVQGQNLRRWLFYWGFSTPSLLGCTAYPTGFAHVATYAIRQTQSVDLSSIESTYGDFDECNWYVTTETKPTESQGIQDRAIVGTLSDFLCAKSIGEAVTITVAPTGPPTRNPTARPTARPTTTTTTTTTTQPTPMPSPSPTAATTYQPTWLQPSSEPTARQWWSSRHWWSSSKHHSKHHHHHSHWSSSD